MSKESFKEKLTVVEQKINSMLQSYAETNWIDSVARVMIFIDDEKADEIIQKYPQDLQPALKEKIQFYKENPEEAYGTILHVMNNYDDCTLDEYHELIEDMQELQFDEALEIINQVSKKNVILAEKVKEKYVSFEDIIRIDDRVIQKILRETDMQNLAIALKTASEEVKEKIYRNMSHRAAEMLKEDMSYMGAVKKQDANDARNEIKKSILRLMNAGEIVLNNITEENLV